MAEETEVDDTEAVQQLAKLLIKTSDPNVFN